MIPASDATTDERDNPPCSPLFQSISLAGGRPLAEWLDAAISESLAAMLRRLPPRVAAVYRGIPFRLDTSVVAGGDSVRCVCHVLSAVAARIEALSPPHRGGSP